jgi:Ni/Fe-hydrogenase 1 B-type cytochrome subunit
MATEARPSPAVTEPSWRFRVYVWEVPVRVTHWVTVGSIAVLTVTGLYLAEPFIIPNGGPVMGTMRFIHYVAAFVFVSSGIVRTYWLFAGNRFSRWRAFIPTNRAHLRELVAQTGWYLFLRRTAPKVLGHNALAAGTYLVVFTLLGLQAVTGFALIGTDGTQPFAALFGWLPGIIGIQTVRLVHHLLMWALIAFMIHHVYSALLVDHWERNGLMSSIFSGYKFATLREIIGARDSGDDLDEIVDIDEDAE